MFEERVRQERNTKIFLSATWLFHIQFKNTIELWLEPEVYLESS